MREILFRGKSIDNAKWLEGDLLRYADTAQIWVDGEYGKDNYMAIPQTVGQYTGLTDKNGKKIFEGDIIFFDSKEDYGQIVYSEYDAMFYAEFNGYDENFGIISAKLCEVVGNIHDNPELLEVGLND